MKIICTALVVAITLSACGHSEKNSVAHQILTPSGLGPVRIGMTVREAERALDMVFYEKQPGEPEGCWYTRRKDDASFWIRYMVQDATIVRIDVNPIEVEIRVHFAPPVRTAKGVTIDSTEKSILRKYGSSLKISEHPYMEERGHYLEVASPDGKTGILFETLDGKVDTFRAGTLEAIRLSEGCS